MLTPQNIHTYYIISLIQQHHIEQLYKLCVDGLTIEFLTIRGKNIVGIL